MAASGLQDSPLRVVPLDLLLRITDFLTSPDLFAFRSSCRAICNSLDGLFTHEFFMRKQFMINVFSLSALVNISQSRLGPHLRYLHISLEFFSAPLFEGYEVDGNFVPERQNRYNAFAAEESTASSIGYHRDLLATALKNLPNLESIIIRDRNSARRTRDGPDAEWKSYGYETLTRMTGIHPRHPPEWRDTPGFLLTPNADDTFSLLLFACAQSGARPKSIEVITQRTPLHGHAFCVPPSIMRDSTLSVIEGLTKLHLNLKPSRRSDGGQDYFQMDFSDKALFSPDTPGGIMGSDHLLYRFLCLAKNLTDLRINQAQSQPDATPINPSSFVIDWLASAASANKSVLPKLQKLSLGRFSVTPEELTRLIKALAGRLQSLALWRITLYRMLPALAKYEPWPKVSFWPSFLQGLRQMPDLNLHHFKAASMGQHYMASSGLSYRFGVPCMAVVMIGTEEIQSIEYTGLDWRRHVEEKEKKIHVIWEVSYIRRYAAGQFIASDSEMESDEEEEEHDGDGDDNTSIAE